MEALVGLDDDGRSLNQFNGVDRIVSAADTELEDGREVALVAVVGLIAAAGAGELARFAIFMTAPSMGPEPAEELLYYGRRDLLYGAVLTEEVHYDLHLSFDANLGRIGPFGILGQRAFDEVGEGGVAVSSHLLEEGALAATELLGGLPCKSMGGFLVFGLQALSLDLLVIVVIDIPTGRFDTGIRRLIDVNFDISFYVDGDISFGCLGLGHYETPVIARLFCRAGRWWAARCGANKIQQIYSKTTAIMLYINLQQITKLKYYKYLLLNCLSCKFRRV